MKSEKIKNFRVVIGAPLIVIGALMGGILGMATGDLMIVALAILFIVAGLLIGGPKRMWELMVNSIIATG